MTPLLMFDLDGTLIDSGPDLAAAINLTRRDYALPPKTDAQIIACVGEGMRKLVERAIPERPELWPEMLERQLRHYSEHCLDRTRPYPGAPETLRELARRGHPLAVVTNKPAPVTRQILEGLGVLPLIAAVVAGGDAPALKPDPAPLRLAAERAGRPLDPSDWMIGDNFTDLAAGARAGIRRCYCTFGYGQPRGETFDRSVPDFPSLLTLDRE